MFGEGVYNGRRPTIECINGFFSTRAVYSHTTLFVNMNHYEVKYVFDYVKELNNRCPNADQTNGESFVFVNHLRSLMQCLSSHKRLIL